MKPVTLRPIAIAQKERVRTEVMVLSDDEGSGGRLKSDSWAKMRQWTKARAGKSTTSKKEDEEAALARECLILRSREAAGPPRSRKVGQKKAIMAKRSNNKCDKFLRVPRHKLFWYACKHELKRARYELHKLFWRIKAWWARREAAWQLFRLKLRL
ncbi:hypothetical protein VP01_2302g2 [Puccinia sorghi]|uniref:Uncharacterized protein n=1 Tax=Puccinia sorghi TaxID=27349 RepID=A0A0L6V7U5_9BASI|nr:hypothetical protein VP01_2302g2 [Puccinia sorghi]